MSTQRPESFALIDRYFVEGAGDDGLSKAEDTQLWETLRGDPEAARYYEQRLQHERALATALLGDEALDDTGVSAREEARMLDSILERAEIAAPARSRSFLAWLLPAAGIMAAAALLIVFRPTPDPEVAIRGAAAGELAAVKAQVACAPAGADTLPSDPIRIRECQPGDALRITLHHPGPSPLFAAALLTDAKGAKQTLGPGGGLRVPPGAKQLALPMPEALLDALPEGMLAVRVLISLRPISADMLAAAGRGEHLPSDARDIWTRLSVMKK